MVVIFNLGTGLDLASSDLSCEIKIKLVIAFGRFSNKVLWKNFRVSVIISWYMLGQFKDFKILAVDHLKD